MVKKREGNAHLTTGKQAERVRPLVVAKQHSTKATMQLCSLILDVKIYACIL